MASISQDYLKIMNSTKKEIQEMSPEYFNGLHANLIKAIPETIFQYITLEQARGLETTVLRRLPSWLLDQYAIEDGDEPYELIRHIDGKDIPIQALPIKQRLINSTACLQNFCTNLQTKPLYKKDEDNIFFKDVKFNTQLMVAPLANQYLKYHEKVNKTYAIDFDETLDIINKYYVPNEFDQGKKYDYIPAMISLPNLIMQSSLFPQINHVKLKYLSCFKFGRSVRYVYKDAHNLLLMNDKLTIASKQHQSTFRQTNKMPRTFFENLYKNIFTYDDIKRFIKKGQLKLYENEEHLIDYSSAVTLLGEVMKNARIKTLPILVSVEEYLEGLYADEEAVNLIKENMNTFEFNGKLYFKYNLNLHMYQTYSIFRLRLIKTLRPYYCKKFATEESQRHFKDTNKIPDLIVECLWDKLVYKSEFWSDTYYYKPTSARTYYFPAYKLGVYDVGYMRYDAILKRIDEDFVK